MSEAANTTILTPDVYLNHLAPDEVYQFEVSRNVYIAVLGVGRTACVTVFTNLKI